MESTVTLTGEHVKSYCDYMFHRFDAKLVKKEGNTFMDMAGKLIGMDEETWQKYTTTIGHTIYSNTVPGVFTEGHSLVGQICLFTHELKHVCQADDEFLYSMKYLTSKSYRTKKEVEAYTANMEMYHILTGKMLSINSIINNLHDYKITVTDLNVAEIELEQANKIISYGGIINEISVIGKSYLETIIPGYPKTLLRPEVNHSMLL